MDRHCILSWRFQWKSHRIIPCKTSCIPWGIDPVTCKGCICLRIIHILIYIQAGTVNFCFWRNTLPEIVINCKIHSAPPNVLCPRHTSHGTGDVSGIAIAGSMIGSMNRTCCDLDQTFCRNRNRWIDFYRINPFFCQKPFFVCADCNHISMTIGLFLCWYLNFLGLTAIRIRHQRCRQNKQDGVLTLFTNEDLVIFTLYIISFCIEKILKFILLRFLP